MNDLLPLLWSFEIDKLHGWIEERNLVSSMKQVRFVSSSYTNRLIDPIGSATLTDRRLISFVSNGLLHFYESQFIAMTKAASLQSSFNAQLHLMFMPI